MLIKDNLKRIQDNIAAACARSGRNPEDIHIIAVTKTVGVPQIEEAIEAGIRIIGENRVQEAWTKFQQVSEPVSWHIIGHLQTNKVKRALQFANIIHSVDSQHLAEEIDRRAAEQNKRANIFVEVNTSGEESKFGLTPDNTLEFISCLSSLKNINITGLMTIGAFLPDPEQVRPCFRKLKELQDKISLHSFENVTLEHLSMGMTNDYQVAIEEGATLVRIGRGLFGDRNY